MVFLGIDLSFSPHLMNSLNLWTKTYRIRVVSSWDCNHIITRVQLVITLHCARAFGRAWNCVTVSTAVDVNLTVWKLNTLPGLPETNITATAPYGLGSLIKGMCSINLYMSMERLPKSAEVDPKSKFYDQTLRRLSNEWILHMWVTKSHLSTLCTWPKIQASRRPSSLFFLALNEPLKTFFFHWMNLQTHWKAGEKYAPEQNPRKGRANLSGQEPPKRPGKVPPLFLLMGFKVHICFIIILQTKWVKF